MDSLIKYVTTFYPISKEAQAALIEVCTIRYYKKNVEVQPIGHTCRTIYFVQKGAVRIYYYKNEVDITESFEFENAFVARAESLFTGTPSRKAIQALEDSELIAIDANRLSAICNTFPELERLYRKIFEDIYVNSVKRIENLQFYSPEERYNNLVKSQPNLLQRIALKFIASYLGITTVSLSRIRSRKKVDSSH